MCVCVSVCVCVCVCVCVRGSVRACVGVYAHVCEWIYYIMCTYECESSVDVGCVCEWVYIVLHSLEQHCL